MSNETDLSQRRFARLAYILYLLNLSFLPGFAFVIMLILWRLPAARPLFVNDHYQQVTYASIVAGVALVFVGLLIVLVGGLQSPWTFIILITYFTLCHALLLLLGVLGFTHANNGKAFRFFNITYWRG